jgi:thiol-disulfide isomerase/thioredoxin
MSRFGSRSTTLAAATIVALLVGVLVVWGSRGSTRSSAGNSAAQHSERRRAPDLVLTTIDEMRWSLGALRGKVVLIDFWATWCGPCREELPGLIAMQRALGAQGVQFVGVSMDDDAGPVRKFCAENRIAHPVAMGDAAVAKRFGGALTLPTKVLIDKQGRVAARHEGAVELAVLEHELRALAAE